MPASTNLDNLGPASTTEFHPSTLTGHVIGGRVVIVDQHALVAQSLAMVLASASVTTYVTTDPSLEAVLRQVRAFDPDLVLIDVSADDSVELVRAIARLGSRILVVSDGQDRIRVAQCLEAGAYGAVSSLDPVDRLLATVRETVAGRRAMPSAAEQDLLGELHGFRRDRAAQLARFAHLSTRESEVLEELMRGNAPVDIARSSYVSIATIRSQIKAILRKLEVNSQLGAVALAYQVGWNRQAFRATLASARTRDHSTLLR
jgi:DNA-binding NarL/FixJ family response regulator